MQSIHCVRCKKRTEDVEAKEVPVGKGGRKRMSAKCGTCNTNKSRFLPTGNPKREPSGKLLNKRLQLNRYVLPDVNLRNLDESVSDIVHALQQGDVKGGANMISDHFRRNKIDPKDNRLFNREGGTIAQELYKSVFNDEVENKAECTQQIMDELRKKIVTRNGTRSGGSISGEGIRDIIKGVVSKAKDTVKAVQHVITKGTRDNWPPSSREVIDRIGNIPINAKSFRVCRHPIQVDGLVKKLVSLTGRKMPHDKLFHLLLVFEVDGKSYYVEKNEDLRIGSATIKYETNKDMVCEPVTYNGGQPITLNTIIEKTKQRMGDRFFKYSSFQNNCQDFIINIMDANQMTGDRAFIKQDVEDLLPVWMQKLANVGTDLKNVSNIVTEGYGNPILRALEKRRK